MQRQKLARELCITALISCSNPEVSAWSMKWEG